MVFRLNFRFFDCVRFIIFFGSEIERYRRSFLAHVILVRLWSIVELIESNRSNSSIGNVEKPCTKSKQLSSCPVSKTWWESSVSGIKLSNYMYLEQKSSLETVSNLLLSVVFPDEFCATKTTDQFHLFPRDIFLSCIDPSSETGTSFSKEDKTTLLITWPAPHTRLSISRALKTVETIFVIDKVRTLYI